jgi:hypothetical protein
MSVDIGYNKHARCVVYSDVVPQCGDPEHIQAGVPSNLDQNG